MNSKDLQKIKKISTTQRPEEGHPSEWEIISQTLDSLRNKKMIIVSTVQEPKMTDGRFRCVTKYNER